MKRKRYPADDPREWLARARSSLTQASAVVNGVEYEDLCFNAQQCAEKAIKAVFIQLKTPFPYTHDLMKLLTLLRDEGIRIPKYVLAAQDLTRFAGKDRYPTDLDAITLRQYRSLLRTAAKVLDWAERLIAKP